MTRNFHLRFATSIEVLCLLLCTCQLIAQENKKQPSSRTATATSNPSPSFDDLASRAAQARQADQAQEAIALYQKALRMRPKWGEGLWYLGTLHYELDHHAEAVDVLRRLLTVEEKNGAAWVLLGLCEFHLRDYETALRDIERGRALGLGDNDQLRTAAAYHAAILFNRFEQFELAFETLRLLAREDKQRAEIMEAAGLNILRMPYLPAEIPQDRREMVLIAGQAGYAFAGRRVEEARRHFAELVTRYPDAPGVHYAYGVFLLGESAGTAMEQFRRELEISPSHVQARLQIAFEYLRSGNPAAGLTLAEEAVRLAPGNFAARNALGRILLEQGDTARAVKELEAGIQLAPDSPEMHFALSRAYAKAGQESDAARERALFLRLEKTQQK
ncbi:MAG TPA: tetratricopeptide repeat protein, partial [Acidobacteriota bacterium]